MARASEPPERVRAETFRGEVRASRTPAEMRSEPDPRAEVEVVWRIPSCREVVPL